MFKSLEVVEEEEEEEDLLYQQTWYQSLLREEDNVRITGNIVHHRRGRAQRPACPTSRLSEKEEEDFVTPV